MHNDYLQPTYKAAPRERIIRADAIKETFAASGVALTNSGRYVDLDRVQHPTPAPRAL